jgi:hypothetical protein
LITCSLEAIIEMKERVRGKKRDDEGNKGNKNKTKKKVAT